MWILKILLIGVFILIFKQDYKDRLVFWYYYIAAGVFAFWIQTEEIGVIPAGINFGLNLAYVFTLILMAYLYTVIRLRKPFFTEVIGIGDLMFFVAIAAGFSFLSFVVLFVFSLLFSLFLHFYLKKRNADPSVPLAGYMSLFFAGVYTASFLPGSGYLFAY